MPLLNALSTVPVADMKAAVLARANPSIVTWERTEGRPRNRTSFERALRAEVHDALWMLSRQWQMGEFQGEDTGSPALAKVHLESAHPHKYRPDGHAVQPFDGNIPLETQVEQRPIAFLQGDQKVALDLRLVMGRYWLKLLSVAGLSGSVRDDFLARFAIARPDPNAAADAAVCAHPDDMLGRLAHKDREVCLSIISRLRRLNREFQHPEHQEPPPEPPQKLFAAIDFDPVWKA
jgi:hypothetical protein